MRLTRSRQRSSGHSAVAVLTLGPAGNAPYDLIWTPQLRSAEAPAVAPNGGYRTLCLRSAATIRYASQIASHRPGTATVSVPAPA
jgi:hypothetical protein